MLSAIFFKEKLRVKDIIAILIIAFGAFILHFFSV
jgi:uncharacterized membrane protein